MLFVFQFQWGIRLHKPVTVNNHWINAPRRLFCVVFLPMDDARHSSMVPLLCCLCFQDISGTGKHRRLVPRRRLSLMPCTFTSWACRCKGSNWQYLVGRRQRNFKPIMWALARNLGNRVSRSLIDKTNSWFAAGALHEPMRPLQSKESMASPLM